MWGIQETEIIERVVMIQYRSLRNWKYELLEHTSIPVNIHPNLVIQTPYIQIHGSRLFVLERYAWDGPTVIPDSADLMEASLFHDALYQLIREGKLDMSFRKYADKLFKKMYIEAAYREIKKTRKVNMGDKIKIGMWARTIYWAVKNFGGGAVK